MTQYSKGVSLWQPDRWLMVYLTISHVLWCILLCSRNIYVVHVVHVVLKCRGVHVVYMWCSSCFLRCSKWYTCDVPLYYVMYFNVVMWCSQAAAKIHVMFYNVFCNVLWCILWCSGNIRVTFCKIWLIRKQNIRWLYLSKTHIPKVAEYDQKPRSGTYERYMLYIHEVHLTKHRIVLRWPARQKSDGTKFKKKIRWHLSDATRYLLCSAAVRRHDKLLGV
jgi:hypothetical protein